RNPSALLTRPGTSRGSGWISAACGLSARAGRNAVWLDHSLTGGTPASEHSNDTKTRAGVKPNGARRGPGAFALVGRGLPSTKRRRRRQVDTPRPPKSIWFRLIRYQLNKLRTLTVEPDMAVRAWSGPACADSQSPCQIDVSGTVPAKKSFSPALDQVG